MEIKKNLICAGLFVASFVPFQAKTIHFISMFDTNDENIGDGMKRECMMINNEFQTIAGYMEEFGFDSEISEYYGDNCGKAQLLSVINSLEVASDDVVVFYYGGHGGRPENSTDSFPQMCLGHHNEAYFVPATLIRNIISKKEPRLTIILTGCCNSMDKGISIKSVIAQSQGYTSENYIDKSQFKKLFADHKGYIQMTSSRPGELSFSGDGGSIFANKLLDVLNDLGSGRINADWDTVYNEIKRRVANQPILYNGQIHFQHPHCEINLSPDGGNGRDNNNDNTDIKKRVNDVNYDLTADITTLVDKSKGVDDRLKLIPNILEKHFCHGAKVMTLGRDMNTVVDYEDADVFLRRITMSPYISQINIVEQTPGRNSLISVHEVRTR